MLLSWYTEVSNSCSEPLNSEGDAICYIYIYVVCVTLVFFSVCCPITVACFGVTIRGSLQVVFI